MTRALILAAGFGTRLGTLSDERPKPLLPVCDFPLIRFAVALLAGNGIREIAVNLHHRGELIERELGDGRALGVEITYSREKTILGTGGGIRRIADWLTDGGRSPFLVVNGKILVDVDLRQLVERHQAVDAAATMVLKETTDAQRWGAIEVGDEPLGDSLGDRSNSGEFARVTRILDQGAPGERACMFTGVHVLSPRLVARLPDQGESDSIRQGYLPALAQGELIVGHVLSGYFHEHSTPARYLEGNLNALSGKAVLRHLPGALTGCAPSAEIAPSATLVAPYRIGEGAFIEAGCTIGPGVVVGTRARVRSGAHLERSVVWPDSLVEGDHREAIITPRGTTSARDEPGRK